MRIKDYFNGVPEHLALGLVVVLAVAGSAITVSAAAGNKPTVGLVAAKLEAFIDFSLEILADHERRLKDLEERAGVKPNTSQLNRGVRPL